MNPFTIIGYVCFQFVVGLLAFGALWRKKGWYTHTNIAASILTIIGVFGTFFGIFLGLQGFEIENIEGSIPALLDALKLAFLTSLVGIFSAIVLKTYAFIYQMRKGRDPNEEAIDRFVNQLTTTLTNVQTSGDINLLAQLVTLNTTLTEKGNETKGALEDIKTDLAGIHTSLTGDEGAVLKQLHILTTTISNKHDELISLQVEKGRKTREMIDVIKTDVTDIKNALTGENESTVFAQLQELTSTVSEKVGEIAAKVGEIATGQLIEALREVIRDFNKNLTEQFGENFKQLNEAVGRTVEWQEQYRQQMDELADEFRIAAQSIEQSRAALASVSQSLMTIEDQSESLVSIAEKLDPILHTLNNQLEAFSESRQRAHDAFPLIEGRLSELTTGFSDTVKTAIVNSYESMEVQRSALATQVDLLQTSASETNRQVTDLTKHFSDTIEVSIAESQASSLSHLYCWI